MTTELAKARGLTVDEADFNRKLSAQKERARSTAKKREGEADQIAPQHTGAHLLNAALRQVLGPAVHQAGQHLEVGKFRHDFTFDRKLNPEELQKVSDLVNDQIHADLPVKRVVTTYEKAVGAGAEAVFAEKYAKAEELSLYHVGENLEDAFSKELCAGPHVTHTGALKKFEILKEESAGAGVRRIYARAVPA